jgi:hypothetical protein
MPPAAMWRAIFSVSAKLIVRRASLLRHNGGTGNTPRKSSVVKALVRINLFYL